VSKVVADIRKGKLAPVYVLYGTELAPVREVLQALREVVLVGGLEAFNHERFEGRRIDAVAPVLEACAQLPMMAERRLVELSDPDQIDKGKDEKDRRAMTALADYIAAPSPTTVLVVIGGVDGRSKLVSRAKKTGVTLRCDPLKRDNDATAYLQGLARARGLTLASDAAHALVAAVGLGQSGLDTAFELAQLHAGDGCDVTLADVEGVVAQTREAVIFNLTDAVGIGDLANALTILDELFRQSSTPPIGQANMVLAMLSRQIRLIMTAKVAKGSIEQAAGVPPFVARKLAAQARRFDEDRLRAAHRGLVWLDRGLKGGSATVVRSPQLALQRWIMEVCGGVPGAAGLAAGRGAAGAGSRGR